MVVLSMDSLLVKPIGVFARYVSKTALVIRYSMTASAGFRTLHYHRLPFAKPKSITDAVQASGLAGPHSCAHPSECSHVARSCGGTA